MNTPIKVVGFLVALVAVFGIAAGVGNAIGPAGEPPADAGGHQMDQMDEMGGMEESSSADAEIPGGLMVSQDGYTLSLVQQQAKAGRDVPITFTIDGPDGRPVKSFDVENEKRMHLIAVRRDFAGYQHVHPLLDADGRWTIDLDLTSGQWRLFTDFKATGADPLTLGTDLSVPGEVKPGPAAVETRTAVVDGYKVTLDGDLTPGSEAKLRLSVTRNGKPVTDLQPYLGAFGHLVALREGDLAYLHVHPDGTPGDGKTKPGPDIVFYGAVPSTGSYHLYLNFRHDDVVRTARFTLKTTDDGPSGR